MTRTTFISFLALTAGIGGALAAGVGLNDDAYGPNATILDKAASVEHATLAFQRADLDKDNKLNADEYASLAIVTAELSRLNGFVAIETSSGVQIAELPERAAKALTPFQRAEVNALSRRAFYEAAGDDNRLDKSEFLTLHDTQFARADRNGDDRLIKTELTSYAITAAHLRGGDV